MKIIFDQGVPRPLRKHLNHTVVTAEEADLDQVPNGELIRRSAAAGFDVVVTNDKNLKHQQNLIGHRIAIVVLLHNDWPSVQPSVHLVIEAIDSCEPGDYVEVQIPFKGR